jgi:glycosyltransferase involved in cell wall biosynthesis
MRILAHLHGYPPVHNAGAEWAAHEMLKRLQTQHGHQCEVYATARAVAGEFDGIPVYMNLNETQIRALYAAHDIILTHLDNTSMAVRNARLLKKPLIHFVHNDAQLARHNVVAAHDNFAIFNSEWLKAKVPWPGDCAVVHPPINHSRYASTGGSHDRITLVNMTIPKGAAVFYEAAVRLPAMRFLGVRGSYGNQVEPPKPMKHVQVVTSTLDMARIYGKTRMILMPSSYESWGRVAMEACGQGIPVIASPTPGLVESLGWAGIFVPVNDIDGWVRAIQQLDVHYDEQVERVRQRSAEVDELIGEQITALHQKLERFMAGERTVMAAPSLPDVGAPQASAPSVPQAPLDEIVAARSGKVVDFYASEPQYADHLLNVLLALPEAMRGKVLLNNEGRATAMPPTVRQQYVIENVRVERAFAAPRGPIVVSSFGDLRDARTTGRPIVLMEHGAGQSYSGRQNSYAGGQDRTGVALLLVPNVMAAQRNHRYHPSIPNAVIGCPKLDQWHLQPPKARASRPVVCVSFHWDATFIMEARSGWQHFRSALPRLKQATEYELVCHAHPRIRPVVERACKEMGIRFIAEFADVVRDTDIFAIDNSSTLFEYASLDRPVVVMNPPWYRRGVNHGLRFWDCADVGVQCDSPETLHEAILTALADDVEQQDKRHAIIDRVYAIHDGTASQAAAEAIIRCDACWSPKATRSSGKGENPMAVEMTANVSFWYRGKQLPVGARFWCDEDDARRLECTRVPGKQMTRASRVIVVSAPVFAPAPAETRAIPVVPEIKVPDAAIQPGTVLTEPPLGDGAYKSIDDPEVVEPDGVEISYECTICGRTFESAQALRGHGMSHKKQRKLSDF